MYLPRSPDLHNFISTSFFSQLLFEIFGKGSGEAVTGGYQPGTVCELLAGGATMQHRQNFCSVAAAAEDDEEVGGRAGLARGWWGSAVGSEGEEAQGCELDGEECDGGQDGEDGSAE